MLLITCPHCGVRNSDEFTFRGEVVPRPDVATAAPQEWRAYLYEKSNVADWQDETWFHVAGCRRFLRIQRHTISNEIRATSDVGQV